MQRVKGSTYANNCGIVGHSGRVVLLHARVFLDTEILHVAASKDDILVDLVGRANLLFRTAFSSLGSERTDIFERHGRLVRIDLVQDADVAGQMVSQC